MTLLTALLAAGEAAGLAVPLGWWWRRGRRPDVWRSMPVPALLVDRAGRVRDRAGPDGTASGLLAASFSGPLPAPGLTARAVTPAGLPVAVSGLARGALVLALDPDPVQLARERALTGLASRFAHEAAGPLQGVRGHLDLLEHSSALSAQDRTSVATCITEIDRLAALARDVLTLTSVRSGSAPRQVADATGLAEQALAGVLDGPGGGGVALEAPPGPLPVRVAPGEIIRALRNLIGNELLHGPGAPVATRVSALPGAVRFAVHGPGPGPGRDDLERLSRPLARAGHRRGTGLGLAITTEILAAHGSRLQCGPDGAGHWIGFELALAEDPPVRG